MRRFDEVFAQPVEFEAGAAISRRAYNREQAALLLGTVPERLKKGVLRWGKIPLDCHDGVPGEGGDWGWYEPPREPYPPDCQPVWWIE